MQERYTVDKRQRFYPMILFLTSMGPLLRLFNEKGLINEVYLLYDASLWSCYLMQKDYIINITKWRTGEKWQPFAPMYELYI